jgi:putative molybdopterin biosynthesis protein
MRIELRLGGWLSVDQRDFSLRKTFALLDGISRDGSVRKAAERLRVSYRSAWGHIVVLEEMFGRRLVIKTRGHGSALTELGSELRDAIGSTLEAFDVLLAQAQQSLAERLTTLLGKPPPKIKIAVSDDPLLMEVLSEMSDVDVTVAGSEEAIEKLRAGSVDAAGFHFGGLGKPKTALFSGVFDDTTIMIHALFDREQGLMLAPGNPLQIRGVQDLGTNNVQFVKRQRGSGTRIWFDRLLAEIGLGSDAIRGYNNEEFTHRAVGGLIASGVADAGMGARSVANRFGLAYSSIGNETYYLAVQASSSNPRIRSIIETVHERSEKMMGYQTTANNTMPA